MSRFQKTLIVEIAVGKCGVKGSEQHDSLQKVRVLASISERDPQRADDANEL